MNLENILEHLHQWFDEHGHEILISDAFEFRLKILGIEDKKQRVRLARQHFKPELAKKLRDILGKTFRHQSLIGLKKQHELFEELTNAQCKKLIEFIADTPDTKVLNIITNLVQKTKPVSLLAKVSPLQNFFKEGQIKARFFISEQNDPDLTWLSNTSWEYLFTELDKLKNPIEFLLTEPEAKPFFVKAAVIFFALLLFALFKQSNNFLINAGTAFLTMACLFLSAAGFIMSDMFSKISYNTELPDLRASLSGLIDTTTTSVHQKERSQKIAGLITFSEEKDLPVPPKKPADSKADSKADTKAADTKTQILPAPKPHKEKTHGIPWAIKLDTNSSTEFKTEPKPEEKQTPQEFYDQQLNLEQQPSWLIRLRIPQGGSNYKETSYWLDTRLINDTIPNQFHKNLLASFTNTAQRGTYKSVTSRDKNCIKPYTFPFFKADKNGEIHYYSHKIKCAAHKERIGCRELRLPDNRIILIPDLFDPLAHERENRIKRPAPLSAPTIKAAKKHGL